MTPAEDARLLLRLVERHLGSLRGSLGSESFADEDWGFLAQQTLEKVLKALLVLNEQEPPRSHSLQRLIQELEGCGETITLAPELLARTSPGDTVFIVARAAEGPRMPLAVLRKQVKDLPLDFKLDDSMAMAPTAKISDHPRVVVIARISKTGEATSKAGDLSGQSAAVAPGASGLVVQISEVVNP